MKMRINRVLAATGVASRRGAELLVRAGRVRVNGEVVTDLAVSVDPASDCLTLDGRRLAVMPFVYFLYNKPRGVIATQRDDRGRPCVGDTCRELPGAPRSVGRLDRASEGLMLLTNDGDLAYRLTHPRYGVQKVYDVTVEPRLTRRAAHLLMQGVELTDGRARFTRVVWPVGTGHPDRGTRDGNPRRSRLRVAVDEGRNRLVRRLFEAVGYTVKRLKRQRLGILCLGRLKVGDTRELTKAEIHAVRRSVGLDG